MPARPYRTRELHDHRARSTNHGGPQAARARRLNPDWPECSAGCGWPVNPAALDGGHTAHPACDTAAVVAALTGRNTQ